MNEVEFLGIGNAVDVETPTYADPLPTVMTVEELAAYMRVDRKSIYEMVARRELPGAVRVGRMIRISTKAVMAWLEGGSPRRPVRSARRAS